MAAAGVFALSEGCTDAASSTKTEESSERRPVRLRGGNTSNQLAATADAEAKAELSICLCLERADRSLESGAGDQELLIENVVRRKSLSERFLVRANKSLEAVFTEGTHERSTERSEITIERATKRATKRATVRTTIRTMKGSVKFLERQAALRSAKRCWSAMNSSERSTMKSNDRSKKRSVNVSIANLGLGLKTAQRLSGKRFARRSDLDLAMRPVERKALGSKSLEGLTNRLASE